MPTRWVAGRGLAAGDAIADAPYDQGRGRDRSISDGSDDAEEGGVEEAGMEGAGTGGAGTGFGAGAGAGTGS